MGGVTSDVSARQSGKLADEVDQQQPWFNLGFANAPIDFDLNRLFLRHVRILCRLSERLFACALVCASEGPPGQFLDQALLVFRRAPQVRTWLCFVGGKLGRLHDDGLIQLLSTEGLLRLTRFHGRRAHVGQADTDFLAESSAIQSQLHGYPRSRKVADLSLQLQVSAPTPWRRRRNANLT